jgi:hypothetical protein
MSELRPQDEDNKRPKVSKARYWTRRAAVASLATASLAAGIAVGSNKAPSPSVKNKPAQKTTLTPKKRALATTAIAGLRAELIVNANFSGVTCTPVSKTIQAGETPFGLSTVGLHEDPFFMDAVFAKNLSFLRRQAETNPALADPNDIPVDTKLKILDNCVEYYPEYYYAEFSSKKHSSTQAAPTRLVANRTLVFQNYVGSDDKTHHDVTVDYNIELNDTFDVDYCMPSPACYQYVIDAPRHHPDGY